MTPSAHYAGQIAKQIPREPLMEGWRRQTFIGMTQKSLVYASKQQSCVDSLWYRAANKYKMRSVCSTCKTSTNISFHSRLWSFHVPGVSLFALPVHPCLFLCMVLLYGLHPDNVFNGGRERGGFNGTQKHHQKIKKKLHKAGTHVQEPSFKPETKTIKNYNQTKTRHTKSWLDTLRHSSPAHEWRREKMVYIHLGRRQGWLDTRETDEGN